MACGCEGGSGGVYGVEICVRVSKEVCPYPYLALVCTVKNMIVVLESELLKHFENEFQYSVSIPCKLSVCFTLFGDLISKPIMKNFHLFDI